MFLGIDLGTSGVKAILVNDRQEVVAHRQESLSVSRPHAGWSEQAPEDWWAACCTAIDGLRDEQPEAVARVEAIGLSGQQHGAVLLDGEGRVLRPAILWNDTRAVERVGVLESRVPDLATLAGCAAMPGFTAPKLLWVARHEPEIAARVAHVLLPKAWVRYRFTGEMIEEMSDASGTMWLDVARRDWSDAVLEATGLSRAAMPALCEGTDRAGVLNAELAARWGMKARPVFAGGAGDNAGGAVGLGAVEEGQAFLSLGTSGVLWVTTDHYRPGENGVHAFCHAVPDRWHQMGVMLSAAASLAWWAQATGIAERDLLAELPETVSGPSPVLFAPYLSGERTPYNDAAVRGGFLNVSQGTSRAEMTQAVLEGVAFAFRDAFDAVRATGSRLDEAGVIGGGSKSEAWVRILAGVLGIPLYRLRNGEQGGAFGAARLARIAATGESVASVCVPLERSETVMPDAALVDAYRGRLPLYRSLYPALTALGKRMGPAAGAA